jgi:L-lactate dehydrogenase complex protein LldG
MSATGSRQSILARIRSATADSASTTPYASLPRNYTHSGSQPTAAVLHLLAERLREYDADLIECSPADLAACIADRLAASGRHKFVAPTDLPAAWLAPGFDWLIDHNLTHHQIELCDGVLTAAFAAIADSGTIVLHHSSTEGRRVLTLLPDWHLCILRATQVVETLPEYFSRCGHPPALVTFISGPSATADIEMTRIKGVHGPRFLNVILVRDDLQSVPHHYEAGSHEQL